MITGVDENPYITTASGIKFHLLYPSPLEINIGDIATALSRAPRFAGHTTKEWTVAQHCLLVAAILAKQGYNAKMQLAGLLHDAAEAYICDVPAPLKWAMEQNEGLDCTYRRIEKKIEEVIEQALQPEWTTAPDYARRAVKRADNIALLTESREFIAGGAHWTANNEEAIPESPHKALKDYASKLCINVDLPKFQYLLTYDVLSMEARRES